MRLLLAMAISTLLLVGGGWLFAQTMNQRADKAWLDKAQQEGASLTDKFALTIERAGRQLYAFSRGLADDRIRSVQDFTDEARRIGVLVGEVPFRAVAFAVKVKAEERPGLEQAIGRQFSIVGEPDTRAAERAESYVVVGATGVDNFVTIGTDLMTDRVLASMAEGAFRSPTERIVGPSVEARDGGLYTPISVRAEWGDREGIVIGLFDFRDAIEAITQTSLPAGLGIEVSERATAVGSNVFRILMAIEEAEDLIETYKTSYTQGGVGWRFQWSVHEDFVGGPDHSLGTAMRWGSVAAGLVLILLLLLFEISRRRERMLDQHSDLLQTMIDCMEEGISVVTPDMKIAASNQKFFDLYGFPATLRENGRPVSDYVDARIDRGDFGAVDDRRTFISNRITKNLDANAHNIVEELPDGRCVEIRRSRTEDGHLVSLYLDVTESRRNETMLLDQARVTQAALDNMHNGLLLISATGRVLVWNDRLARVLGLPQGRLIVGAEAWPAFTDIPLLTVEPADGEELVNLSQYLQALAADETEAGMIKLEGDRWVDVTLHHMPDGGFAFTFTDETARKHAEDKLLHDALHDTVTGLPNRSLFIDRVGQMLSRWNPGDSLGFAVLFLDLDRFKNVNDSLGHDVGDILLVEVARRLEQAIGPGDSIARLAGDEFGILLSDVSDRDDVLDRVHWIQNDMSAAFRLLDQEVFTSVSIGISLPASNFSNPEEMLRAADIAMYRAKDKGMGSLAVFDPQMQTRAITQLQLESDLRRAIERDEITVHFQPLIDLRSGRIAGFESLARWESPDRGLVRPGQFIPMAEDTGLVVQIGAIALKRSLLQMREWRRTLGAKAPENISVNLSARQLLDPELVREIELQLANANVPGSCLKLEVTESMIMRNPEQTARTLMELKQLGVALSIDDFGTGYSSLSYLHRFPFDTLKVDRSFVLSMENKRESREIIRTIALLAHTLGMDVIAEGVESAKQRKALLDYGCEFGQGFFFAKPMAAEAATEALVSERRWHPLTPSSDVEDDHSTSAAE